MEPVVQELSANAYLDEFKIIKTLGSGYHAKVKLAVKDGKEYAIKRFKQDTADLSVLEHELTIMSKLKHNNIVTLYEVRKNATYKKHNGCEYQCFAIILEYINGGELFQYVARCGRFSPNIARTYFTMLLDALKHMHDQGISHRDIKPENILLDKDFNLKVTDFGFSTYLSRGQLHTRLGTEGYMAPQIRARNYQGTNIDLFAAGIILFILYSGSPPFEKATNTDPYYKVFSAKNYTVFWNAHSKRKPEGFYTKQFKDLINNMLLPNPAQRLTMQQVLNHPWTTGDSVTLSEISEQFKIRKQKIDAAHQKQRKQKAQKRKQMQQLEDSGNRSGSEFSSFFRSLDLISLDPSLLKQAQNQQANDLILNQKPKHFIALVQEFFDQKVSNLIADEEQNENVTVTVDPIKFQIIINMNYSVLGQNQTLEIFGQLSKTKDDKLRVRFLKDEKGSDIRSLNLIEILKLEFAYLQAK